MCAPSPPQLNVQGTLGCGLSVLIQARHEKTWARLREPLGITGVSALARDTTIEGDYVQQIKIRTQVDNASVLVLPKGRPQVVGQERVCGWSWG